MAAAADRLRVGARVAHTRAEGPGVRFALWLQGCSIRCPGCCNPHLFEAQGGQEIAVASLLEEVASAARGEPRDAGGGVSGEPIEGVTLLGGEPFDQPDAAATFAAGVRRLGLSLIVFTGFTLDELRARDDPGCERLLAAIDVLVDGRFEATLPETERLWVGSTNQRFHYFTGRYPSAIERPLPDEPLRRVELQITAQGAVRMNGWPVVTSASR